MTLRLLVLAALVAALAGCSSGNSDAAVNTDQSSPGAAPGPGTGK